MAKACKAGTYESRMFEESDLMQHCEKAFGEILIADRFAPTLDICDKERLLILSKIFFVYFTAIVEKILGNLFVFDNRMLVPIDGVVGGVKDDPVSVCKFCSKVTTMVYNCTCFHCRNIFVCCMACAEVMQGFCSDQSHLQNTGLLQESRDSGRES